MSDGPFVTMAREFERELYQRPSVKAAELRVLLAQFVKVAEGRLSLIEDSEHASRTRAAAGARLPYKD